MRAVDISKQIVLILFLIVTCSSLSTMEKNPYVIGIITKIERAEIPNKFEGKPVKVQTHLYLTILKAYDRYGNPINIEDYDYPSFGGDSSFINKFTINQKVKIVCTTSTGRHIKTIELIK